MFRAEDKGKPRGSRVGLRSADSLYSFLCLNLPDKDRLEIEKLQLWILAIVSDPGWIRFLPRRSFINLFGTEDVYSRPLDRGACALERSTSVGIEFQKTTIEPAAPGISVWNEESRWEQVNANSKDLKSSNFWYNLWNDQKINLHAARSKTLRNTRKCPWICLPEWLEALRKSVAGLAEFGRKLVAFSSLIPLNCWKKYQVFS